MPLQLPAALGLAARDVDALPCEELRTVAEVSLPRSRRQERCLQSAALTRWQPAWLPLDTWNAPVGAPNLLSRVLPLGCYCDAGFRSMDAQFVVTHSVDTTAIWRLDRLWQASCRSACCTSFEHPGRLQKLLPWATRRNLRHNLAEPCHHVILCPRSCAESCLYIGILASAGSKKAHRSHGDDGELSRGYRTAAWEMFRLCTSSAFLTCLKMNMPRCAHMSAGVQGRAVAEELGRPSRSLDHCSWLLLWCAVLATLCRYVSGPPGQSPSLRGDGG